MACDMNVFVCGLAANIFACCLQVCYTFACPVPAYIRLNGNLKEMLLSYTVILLMV